MLRIDEIKNLIKDYPEPKEVTLLRETILQAFSNIHFEEEGHKYSIVNKWGAEIESDISSVSSIVERFVPFVDWDEKARLYAEKNDISVESVKRSWEEIKLRAANNGSRVHEFGEVVAKLMLNRFDDVNPSVKPQIENGYLIPYGSKQDAIEFFWKHTMIDLRKRGLLYPLIAECRMYMPKDNTFGLRESFCGTADLLAAVPDGGGGWKVEIFDYKTNAQLESEYNRRWGNTLLAPFNRYIDEPMSKYAIQLSLYAMMLQNVGVYVGGQYLVWLKEDGECEIKSVDYLCDAIQDALMNVG